MAYIALTIAVALIAVARVLVKTATKIAPKSDPKKFHIHCK